MLLLYSLETRNVFSNPDFGFPTKIITFSFPLPPHYLRYLFSVSFRCCDIVFCWYLLNPEIVASKFLVSQAIFTRKLNDHIGGSGSSTLAEMNEENDKAIFTTGKLYLEDFFLRFG